MLEPYIRAVRESFWEEVAREDLERFLYDHSFGISYVRELLLILVSPG